MIKVVEVKRTLTWNFYVTRILPVGFFMALTLHFGNLVYLYLTVSFIQMLKVPPRCCTLVCLFLDMSSRCLIVLHHCCTLFYVHLIVSIIQMLMSAPPVLHVPVSWDQWRVVGLSSVLQAGHLVCKCFTSTRLRPARNLAAGRKCA